MSINFNEITAQTVEAPAATRNRTSRAQGTPFPGWLKETKESGKAKAVTIDLKNKSTKAPKDDENVKELVAMIRLSANFTGLGAQVVVGENVKGKCTVTFRGKARRAKAPNNSASE